MGERKESLCQVGVKADEIIASGVAVIHDKGHFTEEGHCLNLGYLVGERL